MVFDLTLNINTIVVPLVVSISTLVIARQLNRNDKKRDDHEAVVKGLLDKIDAQKEDNMNEWKEEVNANFCTIKANTQKISDEVTSRVPYEHCQERMDKLDVRVRVLGG